MNFEKPYQLKNQEAEGEESPERRQIELLQQSNLESGKKLDIALLLLGRKSAAQLGAYDVIESDQHKERLTVEFQREFSAIEGLLKELGLFYRAKPIREDRGMLGFSFLVADNGENLIKAVDSEKNKDDKTFGLLMGYPETAVSAYRTSEAFNYEEELSKNELERLKNEGVLPFITFMPSRKHWEEELNYTRENQRLIQEKAPLLYNELVSKV